MKKFYIDASIWIDLLEDRKGFLNEPLGFYALKIFAMIKAGKFILAISDYLIRELEQIYSQQEINSMMVPFQKNLQKIFATKKQHSQAKIMAKQRNIPKGDALHAIIARDHKLILVTRDNHFEKLSDICEYYRPEEII